MAKVEPAYKAALNRHRKTLARLSEDRNTSRLKTVYDRAQSELIDKVAKAPAQSMTAHHARQMLAQVNQGQKIIAGEMVEELGDLTREAQVESLRGLGTWIGKLEKVYTGTTPDLPIDQASKFWGIIDKRSSSLLKASKASMAGYGGRLVGKMEQELVQSVLQGETVSAATDRLQEVVGNEWWQAERIVRTETAWAYNATAADGITEVNKDLGDMYMRWEEHVTDNFKPMDKRVGVDSIAMHGQVVLPGGWFVMPDSTPDGEDVSESLIGEIWKFPPNRPNDRAALSPWRPHWGGMAWIWRNGDREFL